MEKRVGAIVSGLLAIALSLSVPTGANAQGVTNLGSFSNWTAWQAADADGPICYISSQPQSSQPSGVNRDPIHFLVIHRKGKGERNEVQTLVGYPMRMENGVSSAFAAEVDGRSFQMLSIPDEPSTAQNENYGAWLANPGDQSGFVDAMKRGSQLVVKGTSQRGTNTTDSYSLSGVTAAMNAIDAACAS